MFVLCTVIDEQNLQTAEFERDVIVRQESSSDRTTPHSIPVITTSPALEYIDESDIPSTPDSLSRCPDKVQDTSRLGSSESISSCSDSTLLSGLAAGEQDSSGAGRRAGLRLTLPTWNAFSNSSTHSMLMMLFLSQTLSAIIFQIWTLVDS